MNLNPDLIAYHLYPDILLRLFLSAFLGGLLGFERTHTGRAAGLRTYAIVCCASALIMMTNLYIYDTMGASDPVRLGAQVISGIGFLGAGSIIVTGKFHQHIKGLTTAAALWASGAIGLACGCGYYFAAITATLIIFFAMHFLKIVEKKLLTNDRNITFYIELDSLESMGLITQLFRSMNITIDNMKLSRPYLDASQTAVTYAVILPRRIKRTEVIEKLAGNEHVIYIEEAW
ncbi:MAG: MgtC/SapB family protein [Lachnospiraceae bacterium]|nr:MgtC/SapB family protein [Lachnospiraceae bacterium]MDY4969623.1 MgtC/SapB family protein [Lachnospiraceae bacterium]